MFIYLNFNSETTFYILQQIMQYNVIIISKKSKRGNPPLALPPQIRHYIMQMSPLPLKVSRYAIALIFYE